MLPEQLAGILESALAESLRLEASLRQCQQAVIDGEPVVVDRLAGLIAEQLLSVRQYSHSCESALASFRHEAALAPDVPFAVVSSVSGEFSARLESARSAMVETATSCANLCRSIRRLSARRLAGIRRSLDFFNKSYDEYDVYGAAGHLSRTEARSRFVTSEV